MGTGRTMAGSFGRHPGQTPSLDTQQVFDMADASSNIIASTADKLLKGASKKTDMGMSASKAGIVGAGIGAAADVAMGIIGGVANKRSREEARTLADQTRTDQLRIRDERDALARTDLRQRGEAQDITQRRQKASMRFQQFQNHLKKRQTRQETSMSAIQKLGENMQKNEALKDMVLSTRNQG